jgi:hypothetical protein
MPGIPGKIHGGRNITGHLDRSSLPNRHSQVTELLRTNDLVLLSFLQALLADAGIGSQIADQHTSVLEGSIGAIPRRLMVDEDDLIPARRLVAEAGYALDHR